MTPYMKITFIKRINQPQFIQENKKLVLHFILTLFFIALAAWFIKHEKAELGEVKSVLALSNKLFLSLGIFITLIYILFQGWMYQQAFRTLKFELPIYSTVILFLKRNFISVFIPAGGVASLAFFTRDIEKRGIPKSKILFASSLYAFTGLFSVTLVAIPISIFTLIEGLSGKGEWFALVTMVILLGALFYSFRTIMSKGWLYDLIIRYFPSAQVILDEMVNHNLSIIPLLKTLLISISIDLCGILHLYIAMKALSFEPSIMIALIGYLVGVISLSVSPFMRGLGAVEVSLTYILRHFGYTSIEAIAITFFYRFFEFWLPLMSGALSFLFKINKLIFRVAPAIFLFALGLINIVSVLTPAIHERVAFLLNFLPFSALLVSDFSVFAAGLLMLITAAFLLKGLKNAWRIALFLSIISFIGHLLKAIDYEEALLALGVAGMLVYSRKEYYIKSNPRFQFVGVRTALITMLVVIIYGTVGFYFLDEKHFDINFDLLHSVYYTMQNFVIIGSHLTPNSEFAHLFLLSINVCGFLSIAFLVYTMIRPFVQKDTESVALQQKAVIYLSQWGNSALDYFKTYKDKLLYLPEGIEGFISYKVSGSFAVVLENAVAKDDIQRKFCIEMFDRYCYENGLKAIYYRVAEADLPLFKSLKKRSLFVGQEGIVDLNTFNLEGTKRRSLRNSVYRVVDKGYKAVIYEAPIKDGILQKLKAVSDEWLLENDRNEIVFSQGMFSWDELKGQTILTVENSEDKIVAFLNIIPDYAVKEATYDLMRKTSDAPSGVMDFMLIELFKYLKERGFEFVNIGFAPLSGIESPQNLTERSMKFAYHQIQAFSHYRGMRDYKEKFASTWHNKYLVYENDFDLLQIPVVLGKVIKP